MSRYTRDTYDLKPTSTSGYKSSKSPVKASNRKTSNHGQSFAGAQSTIYSGERTNMDTHLSGTR